MMRRRRALRKLRCGGPMPAHAKTNASAAGPPTRVALGSSDQNKGRRARREASMVSVRVAALALGLLTSGAAFADDPLPRAKPEDVGMSSERLARIGETLKADIAAGRTPGAVIAIVRRGKLVAFDAYGWRDK